MTAYYNEIDPYAAQWLRNLITAGHIGPGDVDERSIVDVRPDELAGYTQCHFFAGIGGWSLALRLAGWPDDRPVWTGSCPCQPFSAAGKGKAADDERHLWPAWLPLIAERHPAIVFGEQVEAAIGWGWLDAVFADLETEGYACGAAVLPACGVGAPHIRARTWFVADASGKQLRGRRGRDGGAAPEVSREIRQQWIWPHDGAGGAPRELADALPAGRPEGRPVARSGSPAGSSSACELGQPHSTGPLARHQATEADGHGDPAVSTGRNGSVVVDSDDARSQGRRIDLGEHADQRVARTPSQLGGLGDTAGKHEDEERRVSGGPRVECARSPWADLDWLPCTDGKARPVEPGTFPLAHGIPGRVGRLRAYGNAIVPQAAAEFIKAFVGD